MVQLADREAGPYFSRGLALRVAVDDAWVISRQRLRAAQQHRPADTRAKDRSERPQLNGWVRTRLRTDRFGF